MGSSVKLEVRFKNIMLCVHRAEGTDVWFVNERRHNPFVHVGNVTRPLRNTIVSFVSGESELAAGKVNVKDTAQLIDFARDLKVDVLKRTRRMSGSVLRECEPGTLPDFLQCIVRLRGKGKLRAVETFYKKGGLHPWSIPRASGADVPFVSFITETLSYEVRAGGPVTVLMQSFDGTVPCRIPVPVVDGKSVVLIVAGETPANVRRRAGDLLTEAELEEFASLHECFRPEIKSELRARRVWPRAAVGAKAFAKRSADPICPPGQISDAV